MAYEVRRVLETFWGEANATERDVITEIEKELDLIELDDDEGGNEQEKHKIIIHIIDEKINAFNRIKKELNDKAEF
jgi:hypothetical protein